ncbi:23S rRNA (uracil(1939)-C(5))-methyltransferase RlmD [Collinsella sp. An2]|uniref:23S rRNA (uracil(1939)-C(5))-methyltransferase RlmD n=1 Tax=Collinsella sp. An2 TaxID=1965585 RepID=UPI000B37D2A6|nr:23S rRNA (uracil(1939)-C(5))-methyltransferase RlmD [Collinsella sp. An2]OUP08632.1 23S rRNA (uracil(1939)-C(5))-methyltransferase RlmD [Collinsella sp. An2]
MRLTIERMAYGPDGLAHTEDGKAAFVSGAVAGDVVEARVDREDVSLIRATAEEILEPSPHRTKAPCPFVGVCGGCPWGALKRDTQLAAKEDNLRSALERIGKFDHDEVAELVQPIRYTKDAWGYRNKVELAPSFSNGRMRLGMHGLDPNQIISVDSCPLFEQAYPRAIKAVAGALGYLGNSRDLSLERVGVRASRRTGALEVALWTPTGSFPRAHVSRVLEDALSPTGIVRVMTKGEQRARRVSKVELLAGTGSWTEQIAGERMRISAPSFFQVNTPAAEILIDLVMDALKPGPEDLAIDLYCGAGTFTLPLARRADYVAAVEAYGPAVRDLRHNIDAAHLDNVDVIGGDAVREFPDQDADVLVVDPPRAGLAPEAVSLIASTSARDVAYVSCDPATLARDLARFRSDGTFRPVSVTPVDLFPQTFHCETVVHLTRNK